MKVLIADHQVLFREGLASLLQQQPDIDVVGEASSSHEALAMAFELQPDIVLMDLGSEIGAGLNVIKLMHSQNRNIRVVVLSHEDSDTLLFNVLIFGAKGFLLKNSSLGVITASLRAVMRGEPALPRQRMGRFLDELSRQGNKDATFQADLDRLTRREFEILVYIASGATNRQIAGSLFISENTVKIHVHNILEKLDLNNRREVAIFAQRHGLAHPSV